MKTRKQKCIEQWGWLCDNPTKTKEDYLDYLISIGKAGEHNDCWACDEAYRRMRTTSHIQNTCTYCPIIWGDIGGTCTSSNTPFKKWLKATVPSEKQKYSNEMVQLVTTTWEELCYI